MNYYNNILPQTGLFHANCLQSLPTLVTLLTAYILESLELYSKVVKTTMFKLSEQCKSNYIRKRIMVKFALGSCDLLKDGYGLCFECASASSPFLPVCVQTSLPGMFELVLVTLHIWQVQVHT